MTWLIWQLADSAFPNGSFAHSGGLEAACQQGEVRHGADLASFSNASLQQIGSSSLPYLNAAYQEPDLLPDLDGHYDAFTSNHVANRASRLQGCAFLAAVTRIFPQTIPLSARAPSHGVNRTPVADFDPRTQGIPNQSRWFARPPFGHFAPIFGAALKRLGVSQEMANRLFLFGHLRSLIAAAVRLNIVGPMEAQRIQHELTSSAEETLHRCASLRVEDAAQTAPVLDLWQGAHDRLHSRLFQS